ncbi:MAG: hypothetical protein ACYC6N_20115 [Pirellulaceae bacterium]
MPPTCSPNNRLGVWRLLAACLMIVSIWIGLLPALGRTPSVRTHIERNADGGIDPSAKFYSELPRMPLILERVESAHRRAGSAFWVLHDEVGR